MLTGNFGFRLKYKSRSVLNAVIERYGGNGIYDLKGPHSQKDKHALIIYSAEAVSKYLSGTLDNFPAIHSHSGFRESIELLNRVLDLGYTVDYFSYKKPPVIHWSKYQLVIDASNNLEHAGEVAGQKRIFYATTCHWRLFQHNAYKHADSFYKRNKILLYPDRELINNYSDEAADIITCFGGSYQANSFGPNKHKVRRLTISTTHLPKPGFKKTIGAKNKFMWFAGYGSFHKGFDLVVEAFLKMPDMELHIFSHIESQPKLYNWFLQITRDAKNIRYHGWAAPDSEQFKNYVRLCDAVVFASTSEGGAGAIIQCMQFGLIPIINASTGIDLANSKFNITGNDPEEEIASIIDKVTAFSKSETEELQHYAHELTLQYSQQHTLEQYSLSLKSVIEHL
jgi:glycosyltransferase involved in cell wall biosynthesis